MEDTQASSLSPVPEYAEERPQKRQNKGNFTVRDKSACLERLDDFKALVGEERAADPGKLKWCLDKSNQPTVCDRDGKETCIFEVFGEGVIFTSDPEKLNVKVTLEPEKRQFDRDLIALFSEKLPEMMINHLKELSTPQEAGAKSVISTKQRKAIEKKIADGVESAEIYSYIWNDILLDESGPHIPIKVRTLKDGSEQWQLSVTHKNITAAYEKQKLKPEEIDDLPAYVREVAAAKVGEGIVYNPAPIFGTNGDQIENIVEAPNWNGNINFVGKVQCFLVGIKAKKIKWTTIKPTSVNVMGFGAGAEPVAAKSANSLFND